MGYIVRLFFMSIASLNIFAYFIIVCQPSKLVEIPLAIGISAINGWVIFELMKHDSFLRSVEKNSRKNVRSEKF